MHDDTKIKITWDAQMCVFRAKVDYNGKTSNFQLPDAVNTQDAMCKAQAVMAQYRREESRR